MTPSKSPTSRTPPKKVHVVEEPTQATAGTESDSDDYPLYRVSDSKMKPLFVSLKLDGKPFTMELDTGAAYSLVSEATFKELWPDSQLSATDVRLHAYTGTTIPVVGSKEHTKTRWPSYLCLWWKGLAQASLAEIG